MPIIKSAKKRVKQTAVRRTRNTAVKRDTSRAIKELEAAISSGSKTDIEKRMNEAFSNLDRAVKKNIIHKNKAARKKSDLHAKAKAAGHTSSKKTAAKKPAAKPAAKKAPAKKPAVKK